MKLKELREVIEDCQFEVADRPSSDETFDFNCYKENKNEITDEMWDLEVDWCAFESDTNTLIVFLKDMPEKFKIEEKS